MAALVPCPDCGRMVSRSAKTCPECGRPFAWAQGETPKGKPRATPGGDLRFLGGVLLVVAIGATLANLVPVIIGAGVGGFGLLLYVAGRVVGKK